MRVPCPNTDKVCVFHREELSLHTLIRIASGSTNIEMVEEVVGGSDSWWGLGHKWLTLCLEDRHSGTI